MPYKDTGPVQTSTQLDRIEAKLDEVLAFRDLVIKFALPKMPAAARELAVRLAGRRPS